MNAACEEYRLRNLDKKAAHARTIREIGGGIEDRLDELVSAGRLKFERRAISEIAAEKGLSVEEAARRLDQHRRRGASRLKSEARPERKQTYKSRRTLVKKIEASVGKPAEKIVTEIDDLVFRPKGGRPAKDEKGARVAELAEAAELAGRKDYWPDIQKKIFQEFEENTSIKGLQYLRRGHLRRSGPAK